MHHGFGDAKGQPGAECGEKIAHVKLSDQRGLDRRFFPAVQDREPGSLHRKRNLLCTHVRRGVDGVGELSAGGEIKDLPSPFIVEVDDPPGFRRKRLKEDFLRIEIRRHRAVVVEMILRQIGEDRGAEGEPVHAMLIERMRRIAGP